MKNILLTLLVSASLFTLFTGCVNWNDMMLQRALRPEDAKEYNIKGTLFYFTVTTDLDGPVNGLMIMFRGAPDLSIPLNGGIEGFTVDIPTNCSGISRIGVRYSDFGSTKHYWFKDTFSFVPATNRVNYLGRLVIENLMTYDKSFSLRVSNVIQKDRARFAEGYTNQTNCAFTFIELKKETNR